MQPHRIVIAGGGLAGLSLALALKRSLKEVEVVMCDPALRRDPCGDRRAYAIAAAARRMLQALGIWDGIEPAAQPITSMIITDSRLQDPVRPVFLTFGGEASAGEPFAHMVEGGDLTGALVEACAAAGVVLKPAGVEGFSTIEPPSAGGETPERPVPSRSPRSLLSSAITVRIAGETPLPATLLVAADGARSRLREEAGIGWISWPYRQSGIVATVAHERDHEGRAVEHFLPSGPFAILPLRPGGALGHRSSIVWTERQEAVPHLLASDAEDFLAELERRFGLQLGRIALETKPQAFPLSFGVARRFVGDRVALLGDAAHVIHPIAGQGLNLGFHDAAALAEAIADAVRLGLDPGAADTLDVYERARRLDITAMGAVTDGLNRLFSNDLLPVRLIRDLGLGLVDRLPIAKRFFMREAAGLSRREAPRLLRGEAL